MFRLISSLLPKHVVDKVFPPQDPGQKLPIDVNAVIFSFLSLGDLVRCSQVSKKWKENLDAIFQKRTICQKPSNISWIGHVVALEKISQLFQTKPKEQILSKSSEVFTVGTRTTMLSDGKIGCFYSWVDYFGSPPGYNAVEVWNLETNKKIKEFYLEKGETPRGFGYPFFATKKEETISREFKEIEKHSILLRDLSSENHRKPSKVIQIPSDVPLQKLLLKNNTVMALFSTFGSPSFFLSKDGLDQVNESENPIQLDSLAFEEERHPCDAGFILHNNCLIYPLYTGEIRIVDLKNATIMGELSLFDELPAETIKEFEKADNYESFTEDQKKVANACLQKVTGLIAYENVLVSSTTKDFIVWDLNSHKRVLTIPFSKKHDYILRSLDKHILVVSENYSSYQSIEIWDIFAGKHLNTIKTGASSCNHPVAYYGNKIFFYNSLPDSKNEIELTMLDFNKISE